VYDEAADAALLRELIFDGSGITLKLYRLAERNAGKTPDFKLLKNDQLQAFCEMKSPKDDFVFQTPQHGDVAVRENLPFYRKLGGHIRKAAQQFNAPDYQPQPAPLAAKAHGCTSADPYVGQNRSATAQPSPRA
jgi:hypothetical protein